VYKRVSVRSKRAPRENDPALNSLSSNPSVCNLLTPVSKMMSSNKMIVYRSGG